MTVPKIKTVSKFGGRWYENEETGETVPGVTTITGTLSKGEGLIWGATGAAADYALDNYEELHALAIKSRWAAWGAIRKAHDVKWKKAADDGSEVHTAAQKWMECDLAGIPPNERKFRIRSWVKKYLVQYIKFCREFDVKPVMIERTVWNAEVNYAGTFDSVLDFGKGNKRVKPGRKLVDIKSGASGVWSEAALQQTAYRYAPVVLTADMETEPMPEVDEAFALWLRPEGYALIPLDTGPETWEEFKRLRADYEWKIRREKYAVGVAVNEKPLRKKR